MKIGDIIIIDKNVFLEKLTNSNLHDKHELVRKIKSINDNSKFRIINIRDNINGYVLTLDREFIKGHINIGEIFIKKNHRNKKRKTK